MDTVTLEIPECPPREVAALRSALRVSEPLAQVLVRRGLGAPESARAFLATSDSHPFEAFAGIERALDPILAHIHERRRITVHGDYDVDGVCATAILVGALRRLGGEVDWRLPERTDGYGLREQTVHELASRGTSLLITVDCGVSSIEEVALARSLGIEVVITDHHSPRADGALPDAPLVHPRLCGYSCPELCATAVAHKLTLALWHSAGRDPAELETDLDLVALATVADVVELRGENRSLLRRGLIELRRTSRPGLRALCAVSGVDPSAIDERAIGFALAPRINAAGRLFSPAAALELLMTDEPERAQRLAGELDRCNRERRTTEQRILFEAEAQVRELGPQAGYVLAGESWHPGVIGIVAARIAERHNRPAVLVALDGERGRGSGRSIASYDLLGGLTACERHLLRYGGHSAAAGVEIERGLLQAFRESFAAHAAAELHAGDLQPRERVDAIVDGRDIGMELAEELRRLAPFGRGNPDVCLLVREARFEQVRAMGEGRHARFLIRSEGRLAGGVAFGKGATLGVQDGVAAEATFKLEINEWRGASEPRLVLRELIGREQPPTSEPGSERPRAPKRDEPDQPLQLELALP
ncbi:MAG: single-stranded-DNA-specific exonuclease RecJ [Solirubrobacteraceae bacterium]